MKTKRLLTLLVLALVVATCLCLVGCGECKHTGGTATCSSLAICTECNQPYGQYDTTKHQGGTATCSTLAICTDCNQPYGQYDTTKHQGGTATCSALAICTDCNQSYGQYDTTKHQGGTATCSTLAVCQDCNQPYGQYDTTNHQGGTATCSALAVCQDCNQPYGEYDDNNHQALTTTVVSKQTCTTDGVTEYSCTCGYTKTETTPKLSQTGEHNYLDITCLTCGAILPSTDGLEFTINFNNVSYTCTGIGSCTSNQIVISSYNGKPVTHISDQAFENCSNLTSVTITNCVNTIGKQAFFSCENLTNVTISSSVTSIGNAPFGGCKSLTSIEVAADNPNYCSQDGNLYNKDKTKLIQYTCGKTATTFDIPDSITDIGVRAFYGCTNLITIVIPNNVTTIGENAFYECPNLTIYCETPSMPNGWYSYWTAPSTTVEWGYTYVFVDNVVYGIKDDTATVVRQPKGVPANVVIAETISYNYNQYSVTAIGEYAFYTSDTLQSIVLPTSVTTISKSAFSHCTSLRSIAIPNSVSYIGTDAFLNCTSLTSIVIPESVTTIKQYAFQYCDNLTIYCYATKKLATWSMSWNNSNCTVYWAGQWHYDDNGNPTPNN